MKNRSSVVTAAPTSVTNITGFFHMWTGLSFRKLSKIAGTTISRSNKGRALVAITFLGYCWNDRDPTGRPLRRVLSTGRAIRTS